ncbi:YopX family protein [Subtercola sp. RTI3]|uniref:YopX family protein n=1 Tax=Subtercola sp. RTI3 TaxID=3048639 RepID=UPI002B236B32|nr:YopX family protein [Subtercola sp. RTI3]MEA9985671.1 YopX family protein [Subtercola sp. RTI3]
MREIKFRAWDRTTSSIVMGSSQLNIDFHENGAPKYMLAIACLKFEEKPRPVGYDDDDGEPLYESSYELMQYIGLVDKNNVDIYEGDIVQWWWGGDSFTEAVTWGKDVAGYLPNNMGDDPTVLVIGNIYENPELLKAQR